MLIPVFEVFANLLSYHAYIMQCGVWYADLALYNTVIPRLLELAAVSKVMLASKVSLGKVFLADSAA